MTSPRIGVRDQKDSRVAPIMGTPRKSKAAKAPRMTNWQVKTKRDIWDIGSGPWQWGGKPASRPEYITLIMLRALGHKPRFRVSIFGGRRLPGGQVLDIVLDDLRPAVYISVKGYYHQSASAAYNDRLKEMLAMAAVPGTKVLEIWESDLDQKGWLESFLVQNVGARA